MLTIFDLPEREADRLIEQEGNRIREIIRPYDPASALAIVADAYFRAVVLIHNYLDLPKEDMKRSIDIAWACFSQGLNPPRLDS